RAVPEEHIGAAGVETPRMVNVAIRDRRRRLARRKVAVAISSIGPWPVVGREDAGSVPRQANEQVTCRFHARANIAAISTFPPTPTPVRSQQLRWPLGDEEGIAGPVTDGFWSYPGRRIHDPFAAIGVVPGDS